MKATGLLEIKEAVLDVYVNQGLQDAVNLVRTLGLGLTEAHKFVKQVIEEAGGEDHG